jgi:hypothetical protein
MGLISSTTLTSASPVQAQRRVDGACAGNGRGLALAALLAASASFTGGLPNGDILVSYDLFTYFYPLRDFTDSALRAGRLPLWNPYLFLGSPFLANIQTAVFYPLWWPFLILDAPHAVLSSVLLHVYLAGVGMYCFARRSAGLPRGVL